MKIRNTSSVEEDQIGTQFKEKEATISRAGIAFAIRAVSTGLYKNIVSSFIREYTSNAKDSILEAKKSSPAIVRIDYDTENNTKYIEFIDQGQGMSPELIDKVFMNYFESTKRDSEISIGGYGIGSKSGLRYQDEIKITTVFDGVEYEYLLYKSNTLPKMTLLTSRDTTKVNGSTVKIDIKPGDYAKVREAIFSQLKYFTNVIVVDNTDLQSEEPWFNNNYKIYSTPYFNYILDPSAQRIVDNRKDRDSHLDYLNIMSNSYKARASESKPMAIVGEVSYEFNYKTLDKNFSESLMSKIHNLPKIAIKFDIGEVDVTLNREDLEYTDYTLEAIKNKLELTCKWIEDKVGTKVLLIDNFLEIPKTERQLNRLYLNKEKTLCLTLKKNFIKQTFKVKNWEEYNTYSLEKIVNSFGFNSKRHMYTSAENLNFLSNENLEILKDYYKVKEIQITQA